MPSCQKYINVKREYNDIIYFAYTKHIFCILPCFIGSIPIKLSLCHDAQQFSMFLILNYSAAKSKITIGLLTERRVSLTSSSSK